AVHLLAVGGSELRLATAETYVPRTVYRQADAALRQRLARAARQLRRAGLRPQIELAQGEAAAAIVASARRFDADLIVLGHRQRSLFERLFDPSVAQHVLDRTRCSVLIARAG
ncbi:MAG TPA: universal stress protein, partial [Gammaproteobacteria bacterium]|nr:universal stress protein [Gammaproteobacteria bacterium]